MRTSRPWGLGTRLVIAMAVVVAVAIGTVWAVTHLVGPGLFHSHLAQAGLPADAAAAVHAEEAFRSATAISLGVSIALASATALIVGLIFARRLAAPLAQLARAASYAGEGRFDQPIASPRSGREVAELVESFNDMSDRLAESQRLRQQLFADVAHELRTPAATLTASIDSIEDGVREFDDDMRTVMRRQIDRISHLAGDMSAVMQAENQSARIATTVISPAALIADASLGFADRFAAAGVRLDVNCEPNLPLVEVDPQRMHQVLANLLDNALRHTPSGGQVTITATAEGGCVNFAVTDTGDGIAAEDLPHVFERFYRTDQARDRSQGGSGVGLAIVKALVESHGGRVGVASAGIGQGATFSFAIPAVHTSRYAQKLGHDAPILG